MYASWPEAQPGAHTRISSAVPRSPAIVGTIDERMKSHAAASRKKEVTLMRIVLKSWTNSLESCVSRSWYSAKVSSPTASMRFAIRRRRLGALVSGEVEAPVAS